VRSAQLPIAATWVYRRRMALDRLRRALIATAAAWLGGCAAVAPSSLDADGGADVDPGADADIAPPIEGGAPLATRVYVSSTADFLNPERGWMQGDGVDLNSASAFGSLRARGHALVFVLVRLDAYRTMSIAPAALDEMTAGFARLRAAGAKAVLRFTYNNPSGAAAGEDADAATIDAHIAQLRPVLQANADVIAVLQAGFIGRWGTWLNSTHALTTPLTRRAVLDALLAALPASRMIQVRTPAFKAAYQPAPLSPEMAFRGDLASRVGHHNDCFLGSDNDVGTYLPGPPEDPHMPEDWRAYVESDSRYVPVGGTTCAEFLPRSGCAQALAEMERLHWSFIAAQYNPAVLLEWRTQGCFDQISRRLGYRIALVDAAWTSEVAPGGVLAVQVRVRNEGFAAMYNPRTVRLVLEGEGLRRAAPFVDVDPRRWTPGSAEATFAARFRVPPDAAPGTYRLALWLPDDATTLRDTVAFSVRLANEGTWRPSTGDNLLTDTLRVSPTAPAAVDPRATDFVEVP
jgi:hypothetical protein